jgi:hypothetical protein
MFRYFNARHKGSLGSLMAGAFSKGTEWNKDNDYRKT